MPEPADLDRRLARVQLLLLDVDGVLTDGRIVYSAAGDELKAFHVRDGVGLKLWQEAGNFVGIVTGRSSHPVSRRAEELGITHVLQGIGDKVPAAETILGACGVSWDETASVGDDLPDLPVARRAGASFAVADACAELRAAVTVVTRSPGGHGAVREVVEKLLRARGGWERAVAGYGGGVA